MDSKKTLLISGGSTGLGLAVIEFFARANWKVIVLSRSAQTFPFEHHNITIIDCTHSVDSISSIKNEIESHIQSGLDLLINNVGYALVGALETIDEAALLKQFEVNFLSHVLLTQKCLPFLRLRKGKIFNISSLFGSMGCPFNSLYCASKYAVEGFNEALHFELKPQHITCSVLVPGQHHTNFGKNMIVCQPKAIHNPIYQKQYQGFCRLKETLTQKKGNSLLKFAEKVYALAHTNKLPPKILMNKDSCIPQILRKLIPSKLYHFLQHKMFSKYFYPKECL